MLDRALAAVDQLVQGLAQGQLRPLAGRLDDAIGFFLEEGPARPAVGLETQPAFLDRAQGQAPQVPHRRRHGAQARMLAARGGLAVLAVLPRHPLIEPARGHGQGDGVDEVMPVVQPLVG